MDKQIDLRQGDCLEVMKTMASESVDLIITSPPYFNAKEYSQYGSYTEYLTFIESVFFEAFRLLKKGRMACINISVVIEPRPRRSAESKRFPIPFHLVGIMEKIGYKFLEDIIWVKPSGSAKNRNGGFFRHRQPIAYKPNIVNEYVLVFQKPINGLIDGILRKYPNEVKQKSLVLGEYEKTNVWYINPDTKNEHPAPFPINLVNNLISYYSFVNDTVLDLFMGSGTTGVACVNTNRNFIGIELYENYFNIAKERIYGTIETKAN